MMDRREFLRSASMLSLSYLLYGSSNIEVWAQKSNINSKPNTNLKNNKLIIVFLRGAMDGLSAVVPYGDPNYYRVRPTIAIAKPKQELGLLDLDGYFGLHPSLSPLLPYWQNKSLAFIHASGSPDSSRSHFDAQDYMESGTPGIKTTSSGWLNRLLTQLPSTNSPIQAINIGETLPRILQGKAKVASYSPQQANRKKISSSIADYPVLIQYYEAMYANRKDSLAEAFKEGMNAHYTIKQELAGEMVAANRGAPDAGNFKNFGRQLGLLFAKDPSTQVGFIAIGGWDTHVNQGSGQGQLANKLTNLANGLNELIKALGDQYKNTIICVVSEFGRTVKENGNGGTDHGHGNVMMLLGNRIAGSKIYGNWQGLSPNNLYEGRDLAVTTDFRSILIPIIHEHMQIAKPKLAEIFPGYNLSTSYFDFMQR